jgi:hypothetical protein
MLERTEEQVVRIWAESANLKNLNHVEKLPVNVSYYRNGGCDVNHIALLHQQFFRFGAYGFDHRVRQQLLSIQPLNALVQVDASY